jgi:aspartate/tyrosine/aromatic aminotransferase
MSKDRVLGLMALRERARMAVTLADLREVKRQKDEADRVVARLGEALSRQGGGPGIRLASEIMAERAMTAQLTAEIERQRDRLAALASRVAEEQAKLALQEQRQQKLVDEAGLARRNLAAEKLATREAAMPARRR